MATATSPPPVGELLRTWRVRRRKSQLALALEADISTRHLSFLETGRSTPSREMVLRLAAQLEVPLRDRNTLLLAAGYAPAFRERPLEDPALAGARQAVELILAAHEPWPALVVDRHWNLVTANAAVAPFLEGVAPRLLQPPLNVLRLTLEPEGLAARIVNLPQWREHLLARLDRQVEVSRDPVLEALRADLCAYPPPQGGAWPDVAGEDHSRVVVPLQVRSDAGTLSFISTTTVFGTPVEVTLSELALETFFPADAKTAEVLRALSARGPS
jgi:transcriptional regulator with XRE-family HTH domain